MKTSISLHDNTVHLWRVWLNDFASDVQNLVDLLSPDEKSRASRFYFDIHRERFVIARAFLRKILHLYTDISPASIQFTYGPHGKPSIDSVIQFNLSHSDNLAVYAITLGKEIGVDVEKVKHTFKENIAKKYFSAEEYSILMDLAPAERARMFYHFWARKEALQKATGNGLFENAENIADRYHVASFFVHDDFEAAFATTPPIHTILQWQWTAEGYAHFN